MRRWRTLIISLALVADLVGIAIPAATVWAEQTVKPGDVIAADDAARVKDLLAPGTYWKVLHGMQLTVAPTERIDYAEVTTLGVDLAKSVFQLQPI